MMAAKCGVEAQLQTGLTGLYDAGRQAWKVRGVLWFALACCLGSLYSGFILAQTYGLSAGDGGVLRPFGERLALGGFVALLGLFFAGGMLFYVRLYINRVWLDEPAQQVVFETIRLWGSACFHIAPKEIIGSRYHAGELYTLEHDVNAPWHSVRLQGRRLALILDGQGHFLQPALAARLLNLKRG